MYEDLDRKRKLCLQPRKPEEFLRRKKDFVVQNQISRKRPSIMMIRYVFLSDWHAERWR